MLCCYISLFTFCLSLSNLQYFINDNLMLLPGFHKLPLHLRKWQVWNPVGWGQTYTKKIVHVEIVLHSTKLHVAEKLKFSHLKKKKIWIQIIKIKIIAFTFRLTNIFVWKMHSVIQRVSWKKPSHTSSSGIFFFYKAAYNFAYVVSYMQLQSTDTHVTAFIVGIIELSLG